MKKIIKVKYRNVKEIYEKETHERIARAYEILFEEVLSKEQKRD